MLTINVHLDGVMPKNRDNYPFIFTWMFDALHLCSKHTSNTCTTINKQKMCICVHKFCFEAYLVICKQKMEFVSFWNINTHKHVKIPYKNIN